MDFVHDQLDDRVQNSRAGDGRDLLGSGGDRVAARLCGRACRADAREAGLPSWFAETIRVDRKRARLAESRLMGR